jgi:hypothetical protein
MSEYLPKHAPGKVVTRKVGATAVTGGQLVTISADNTVIPTTGAGVVEGVAGHDGATGTLVPIHSGGEHELTFAGALAAGARVQSAANGEVAAWDSVGALERDIIGHVTTGAGAGAKGRVRLYQ